MSIARASMSMAEASIGTKVGISVLKSVMDLQKQSAEALMQSMGMGQNLSVQG